MSDVPMYQKRARSRFATVTKRRSQRATCGLLIILLFAASLFLCNKQVLEVGALHTAERCRAGLCELACAACVLHAREPHGKHFVV